VRLRVKVHEVCANETAGIRAAPENTATVEVASTRELIFLEILIVIVMFGFSDL
jgi:hypothetical protein